MAPYGSTVLGQEWDAMAAFRALVRAEEAVDDAVRLLLDAEAVHWTGPGAAGYRRLLDDTTDGVRRSRVALREATGAVAEHAAAGRFQGDAPPWPAPRTWEGASS
jgi:hypothetical protein